MVNPQVSIIVPVYKTVQYLPRCIESILGQTFRDFELILVSDGPKAEHDLCDKYAGLDSRILVVKDVKKGLGGARNAGLNVAKGEYILFVDSDDYIEQTTLEDALNVSHNVDLVVFGVNIKCEQGAVVQKGLDKYLKLPAVGKVSFSEDLVFSTNVSAWNKLWRKSIIDRLNLRFPECLQYEDFPFYYTYTNYVDNVFYLDKNLYSYVQRKGSGMSITFAGNLDYVKQHIDSLACMYKKWFSLGLYNDKPEMFFRIFSIILQAGMRYIKPKSLKREFLKYARMIFVEDLDVQFELNPELSFLREEKYDCIINKVSKEINFGLFKFVKTTNGKFKIFLLGVIPVFSMKLPN